MPKVNNCLECGKPLDHSQRYDAKFDTTECRRAHQTATRKIDRAFLRARAAIDILNSFLEDNPTLSGNAGTYLYQLHEEALLKLSGTRWYCEGCGQMRFAKPEVSEECSFCGQSKWKIKVEL